MANMSELYIKELKHALNHRHASVLIGSGFSMNSDNVNPIDTHKMPNWYELADAFCEKIGIKIKDPDTLKENRYLDPLILADKVEAMYGRPFLDELLIDQMKNDLHKPSELHKKLLSLPWNDVFTTNYDTLLERTLPEITNKYGLVLDQNDLMHSRPDFQSRIIKLHGSFPSSRPFIITKEDFRKYPNDHAPFVNTVQQSLLENTFCLIGFSGDDPNFLSWIGWIHDNLGLQSPKILMVTDKPVDKAKERLFITKNVNFIVLREVYNAEGYRALLEAFLDDLLEQNEKYKKRRDASDWPDLKNYPEYQKGKEESFLNIARETRQRYPGYITVPYSRLKYVEYLLMKYHGFIWRKTDPTDNEVEILYEYCWLTNKIFRPLFSDEIKHVEAVIGRHKEEKNSWGKLKELCFALLYSYRLYDDNNAWSTTYDTLNSKIEDELDKLRLAYEEIMFHLYNLNISKVETLLDSFAPSIMYPELSLKKGSLVALFGRYDEAERLLKESLLHVRKTVCRDERESNKYRSLESCIVSLYNHVNQAHRTFTGELWNSDSNKEYLNANYEDVYIWDKENRYYSSSMTDYYKRKEPHTVSFAFDVGVRTEKSIFSYDKEAIKAYQFIGFREATGHPFKIGSVTNKDGVIGTALRINAYNIKLPVLLYYLSGEKKIVEEALTRAVLAAFSSETIDDLLTFCISSLQQSLSNRDETETGGWLTRNIWEYSLDTMPEVVSRLISKCSDDKFDDVFSILIDLYINSRLLDTKGVNNLAKRFMNNSPVELLLERNSELFSIPVNENEDSHRVYRDLVELLYLRLTSMAYKKYLKIKSNDAVETHLKQIFDKYENTEYPDNVLSRLIFVYLIYDIKTESKEKFKSILWNEKSLDEFGVPNVPGFLITVFYDLPNILSDNELEERLFKKTIYNLKYIVNTSRISDCSNTIIETIQLISKRGISKAETDTILPIILDICKKYASYGDSVSFGGVNTEKTLKQLGELAGILLLESGYCSARKNYSNSIIDEIMTCLHDAAVPHVLLRYCIEKPSSRTGILESSLFSENESERINAVNAPLDKMVALIPLIKNRKLPKEFCDDIASTIKKHDSITKVIPSDDNDSYGKKMESREILAVLACSLNDYYSEMRLDQPDGVKHWENIVGDKEEFAEIRRSWE